MTTPTRTIDSEPFAPSMQSCIGVLQCCTYNFVLPPIKGLNKLVSAAKKIVWEKDPNIFGYLKHSQFNTELLTFPSFTHLSHRFQFAYQDIYSFSFGTCPAVQEAAFNIQVAATNIQNLEG